MIDALIPDSDDDNNGHGSGGGNGNGNDGGNGNGNDGGNGNGNGGGNSDGNDGGNGNIKVRPQSTPNPHAIKFIINEPVKVEGKVSYRSIDDAAHVPMVENIFNLENISQVFLFQNTMTITHNGNWDNEELKSFIIPIIKSKLPHHDPKFKTPEELKEETKKAKRKGLSPDLQEIENILDRTIRPGLRADGGDIEINDYSHPELFVTFQGACGSCPSSLMGTLQAIQSIMAQEFKDDIQVIPE